jgi:hypothetical protein
VKRFSKAYQTEVITKQVEASNLWAFFQAKSIRKTSTDSSNPVGADPALCGGS